ncbi:MAG TPA: helix-turn-helix transcriptional regulator [Xanthobacteraceae bacterium]|nr:helix-turn-helix transcriptional regulator [Xanthobacteraceae bacterium]
MVTKRTPPRRLLFLTEWRKHLGISAETMAEAMGVERESIHRMEREQNRMNVEKMARYAEALGIPPEKLWRKPTDQEDVGLTAEERQQATELLKKLVKIENQTGH